MIKKKKLRVAIQGIATSFHEVAALTYFDQPIETIECLSFHKLCEALKTGKADVAVMAIENSIAGSILPNYFLFFRIITSALWVNCIYPSTCTCWRYQA
jgi:prephenate dehydratase